MNSDAPYESAVRTSLIPFMEEGTGDNFPPHFEKLRVAICPPFFLVLNLRKIKAFLLLYGSIYVVQLTKCIRIFG
jgi:hypothetical protein